MQPHGATAAISQSLRQASVPTPVPVSPPKPYMQQQPAAAAAISHTSELHLCEAAQPKAIASISKSTNPTALHTAAKRCRSRQPTVLHTEMLM